MPSFSKLISQIQSSQDKIDDRFIFIAEFQNTIFDFNFGSSSSNSNWQMFIGTEKSARRQAEVYAQESEKKVTQFLNYRDREKRKFRERRKSQESVLWKNGKAHLILRKGKESEEND